MGAYLRPTAVREAVDALAAPVAGAGAEPWVLVAGATDHYPSRVGRMPDENVLDLSGLHELHAIREYDEGWWIGAGTTWTDLVEAYLPPLFDGLRRAARTIGGRQVQNRGTLAGNVCNASPAADGVPNLIALGAEVELESVSGRRRLPVEAFITGNRATQRRPDELVSNFLVPRPIPTERARSTFLKLGSRAYLVISIAMVAVVVQVAPDGTIERARIAVGACSAVARRLSRLESDLAGVPLADAAAVPEAEHLAELSPIDDVRGTAQYRRDAALVLVRRALAEVAA